MYITFTFNRQKFITVASKTSYYLNAKSSYDVNTISIASTPYTIIQAVSAYL